MDGRLIDALNERYNWPSAATISYTFLTTAPDDSSGPYSRSDPQNGIGGEYHYEGFQSLDQITATEGTFDREDIVREVLKSIEAFTDVTFSESPDATQMTFAFSELAGLGGRHAGQNTPISDPRVGDVWFSSVANALNTEWVFQTFVLHEIGHALGLAHPDVLTTKLPEEERTTQFTIMGDDWKTGPFAEICISYQLYDIAALQLWYGADYGYKAGGTTWDVDDFYATINGQEKAIQYCIWDGGGTDTLSAAGAASGSLVDLREGKFSSIHKSTTESTSFTDSADNVSIAFQCQIENAIGSDHSDLIIGNHVDNKLEGGKGNDFIFGDGTIDDNDANNALASRNLVANSYSESVDDTELGSGEDTILGGEGKDQLWGGEQNDFLYGGTDADTADEDDTLYGGDHNDTLTGGRGDDLLHGGQVGEGWDKKVGLADGTDTADYSFSTAGIVADLETGTVSDGLGGFDLLVSIEVIIGSEHDDKFKAGEGEWKIDGGAGNDTIDYSGIQGGRVEVDLGAGTATLPSGTEQELLNIENVTGSSQNDRLYGDSNDNILIGGAGDDVLDGRGGNDTLIGGAGGDTFVAYNGTVIVNPDVNDRIQIGGEYYVGGQQDLDENGYPINEYYEGVNGEKYWDSGGNLKIELASGATVILQGWSPGDAGINLGPGNSTPYDPIVFDLDGDGFELFALNHPTFENSAAFFDMDLDGVRELTGWVKPDDALLVVDRDANGSIDDASELVGAGWFMGSGGQSENWGLAELFAFDTNLDGVLNSQDDAFSSLLLWQDTDSDGFTDPGELKTLGELGIESIGTGESISIQYFGNSYINRIATFTRTDGSTSSAGEAWFPYNPRITWSPEQNITDPVLLGLPDIPGFGEVQDLRVAMANDTVLRDLVSEFSATSAVDAATLMAQIDAIIFRWRGVDDVNPLSRGEWINAQWLASVEVDRGNAFTDGLFGPLLNPDEFTHSGWVTTYQIDRSIILADLLAQTSLGQELFPGLQFSMGSFLSLPDGVTLSSVLSNLSSHAPSDETAKLQYWNAMASVLMTLQHQFTATFTEFSAAIEAAMSADGVPYSLAQVVSAVVGGDGNDVLAGRSSDNSDFFTEFDLIVGGAGNDTLNGGYGGDTYVFGKGHGADQIIEHSDEFGLVTDDTWGGTNVVRFTADVAPSDVTFTREAGTNNLIVSISGTGDQMRILDQFVTGVPAIELFIFADGTVVPWGDIQMQVFPPSAADDYVVGANDRDDTLDGGAGNDTLEGGTGNDTYHFGIGYGSDQIVEPYYRWDWYYGHFQNDTFDTIQFGPDITFEDLEWYRTGTQLENLVIKISGTSDQLTIWEAFSRFPQDIERFELADGTTWGTADVRALFLASTSGADSLVGFESADDVLDGGAGNDVLEGKSGSDVYVFGFDYGHDTVVEYGYRADEYGNVDVIQLTSGVSLSDLAFSRGGASYNDLIISLVGSTDQLIVQSQFYSSSHGIEEIRFADGSVLTTEQLHAILLQGTPGEDRLIGWGGYDKHETLDGGAGNDILQGRSEFDTYVFGRGYGSDRIIDSDTWVYNTISLKPGVAPEDVLLTRQGNDLVLQIVGTEDILTVQNLFSGEFIGEIQFADGTVWDKAYYRAQVLQWGAGNDTVIGYETNDVLGGGAGNDLLDGKAGVDTLTGGAGDDTFVVDNAADVVIEIADEGIDLVRSSVSYVLSEYAENLTLTGTYTDINGTGNALDNVITGNGGTNVLDGGGGNDTLMGGGGGDVYIVDSYNVALVENANEGTDTVQTALSWILAANFENLTLTGSANVDGTGNSLANAFVGNAGANVLTGGAGNDTYYVDALDQVIELAGDGTDKIVTEVDWVLAETIENLTLAGSANVNGTGNASNNAIIGNAGNNVLIGANGNDTLDGGGGTDTLIGGAGNDLYTVDNVSDVVDENAGEGTDTIKSSVAWTLAAGIENLTLTGSLNIKGTGNDLDNALTGNSGRNRLAGESGNDTLDGGTGIDTLIGGLGNDVYVIDNLGDVAVENAAEGIDLVKSSVSYTLAAGFENLTLTGNDEIDGTGNELDNVLVGNGQGNKLAGLGGNDTLDAASSGDTLIGGIGDDTYVTVGSSNLIIENGGEGTDLVLSSVTHTLAANVENLALTGTSNRNGTGNELDNILVGNSGANVLTGDAGNDVIDGGLGNDTMVGGVGNDGYVVQATGDVIIENADEGFDVVAASASFTLSANLEHLTLTGTAAINGTGNALNNAIAGNVGNNILDGAAGNDTLTGGAGNDTYIVDSLDDVTTEAEGEGTDTVQSAIGWALAASIENLTLNGSAAINGTGNELDNSLTGNTGANELVGGSGNDTLNGGAGADSLAGGTGNDTYVVDNAGDLVMENADKGLDLVQSSVTYALAANVENLTLTGSTAINGTGNELDNILLGNTGANQLSGGAGNDRLDGGAGNDTMTGGSGDDTYVVQAAGDVVTEAVGEGTDTIESSITIAALAANVENLTLTGAAAINGTGNGLDNVIIGNSAVNVLSGGIGADTLIGGTGNDTYVVDNAGDVIVENESEGADLVQSSVTYTLAANVENLTLTGSAAINGTGNDLGNALTGNTGANQLNGGAGDDSLNGAAGADTLTGGAGNDTYVVDNAGDVTTENADEGTDLVQSSVTYTLAANIENLTLTGTAAINGTGNSLDNLISGNSGNNILDGGSGADSLAGGAGNDTYVVDSAGDIVTEGLNQGTADLVQSSVSWALGANAENLTLTGNAVIDGTGNELNNALTGNTAVNLLTGGAGNDTLNGGAGADTLIGGTGDDTYVVGDTGDVATELTGEGVDTVQSSITWTLAGDVEHLTLTGSAAINGTGNSLDNAITGNTGANQLGGGAGNDTLNGGAGVDTMTGGIGDDVYIVDNASDVTTEASGEGTDLVQSSATYTLAANVENLTLTGSAAINGTGNALDNVITGNSGANVMTGGTGADTLIGGAGNDTYVIDDIGDVTTEGAGQGTDLVQSSLTWTLATNIENLTLTGAAAIDGTGNQLNNALTGNAAANQLNGADGNDTLNGGTGADTMVGGTGNDTYVVDNAGDVTTEGEGEGTDTVQSSITWALAANIEHLTLTGSAAINGTGNELDNALTGTTGVNQLSGGAGNDTLNGGTGADTLIGGTGNDTYVVDNAGEVITESADEGTDLVQSSVSYTLAANVENLTLTGSAALNGTGNALDNILVGNTGANQLNGGAGNDRLDGSTGNDTMTGGSGNDTFVVQAAGDVVNENVGEGTDTIESSIAIAALANNVENLVLTGATAINGTGNALDNAITGNGAANTLDGGIGEDTLVGGAGIDNLLGGDGDDLLVWDGADTLNGGAGRDTLSFASSGTLQFDATRMLNLEVVDLGGGDDNNNGITLSVSDVLNLASSSGGSGLVAGGDDIDLVILGDADGAITDDVSLTGGWSANGSLTTSEVTGIETTFNLFVANGVQVAVQQGLEQVIA